MAITILSEFSFEKSGITSTLLSPFMRPVLHFKVSGASGVTNPTAQIEFDGTTEDVTIDATFLETVSTEHFFFVDLSDIMKYLMASFDGANYPDDLEFINGDLLQSFDEYFRTLDIDIYFERGTANEQTSTATNTWLYLADQLPIDSGFNLWKARAMEQLSPMKWVKDTYNALFLWLSNTATTIRRKEQLISLFTSAGYDNFTSSGTSISVAISDGSAAPAAALALSNVFAPVKAGDKILIVFNLTLNSGELPTVILTNSIWSVTGGSAVAVAGVNTIEITSTADLDAGRVWLTNVGACSWGVSAVTVSRSAYSGTPTAGYFQLKFAKDTNLLNTGLNTLEVANTEVTKEIVIDYDPDCIRIPLCWQHPLLGYVSFPFNGNKVTAIAASKGPEYQKFLTSMKSVNSLKTISGYKETRRVTLTTKADSQYWPLLESLYSSRHVYLFIGDSGDNDTTLSWVECEVAGGASTRNDRTKGQFTVELILPEHFNIRF